MTGKFPAPQKFYKAINVAGEAPPHDDDAEEGLLAYSFASTAIFDAVSDVVSAREFYNSSRARIWFAMQLLRAEGKPIDAIAVLGRLRERDEFDAVGDDERRAPKFVSDIATRAPFDPDPELALSYALKIREQAHRRRVADALAIQLGEAYSGRTAHKAFVEGVEASIFNATRGFETASEGVDLATLVAEEEHRIAEIEAGRVSSGGIPFGLAALDAKLGGGAPGEVTIIAGRPGMGKTSLLRDIAVNVAASNHDGIARGVLIFSLEMTRAKFFHRMVSAEANVNLRRVIGGKLVGVEAERAGTARDFLRALPIVIDDATGLTPSRLRSRLRRAMMRFNNERQRIALVAVDQLGWMRPDRQYGTDAGDRSRELGDILRSCVEILKETEVHGCFAHQLNRDVKNRTGKALRPRMTDLAESGDIEKHSHNIVAVHRPEYYESDKDKLTDEQKRLAELLVLKQRDGATGIVRAEWHAESARFRSEAA